jgi:hypothetical protein
LLTNQNSPNLIRTLWAPVIWARKQEMKYKIAMWPSIYLWSLLLYIFSEFVKTL